VSLASLDRRSEDVRALTVVIAELELSDIQRHIFAAHFVECADNAALEDRPKAFNGLSVNCTDNILTSRMVNSRVRIIPIERIIAGILICAKQADFVRDRFANEGGESGGIHIRDYACNDVTFAADSTDDWSFAGTDAAGPATSAPLIPMPILCQAADESFVNFDNSAELINVFHQRDADLVAHGPRGFIRAKAHIALNLQRAYAFLAGQHQMDYAIPFAKRLIGVLEYCSGNMRKAITGVGGALIALPVPWPVRQFMRILCAAARAANTIGPTTADEICATSIFVRKHPLEFGDRELMDWFGLFACHDAVPSDDERIMA
jgi:hypothetical protein